MSRLSIFRAVLTGIVLATGLAACGSGGTLVLNVRDVPPADSVGNVRIYVATTRDEGPEASLFTGERGPKSRFASINISIPKAHKAGELELPSSGGLPEPAHHFTVTEAHRASVSQITAEVKAAVAKLPPAGRDVLVFVHGYNTTFADAAFRLAQIVHDSGFKGVPVLFTWPSRGELLAYPYDRESALFSRDNLELSLRAISRDIGAGRVDILAHSMGTMLTLEVLRQAHIRGDGSFGGKLRDVILASPDVDVDVFRAQIKTINRPITVFVSKDDKALAFSRKFAGDKRRLGAISSDDADILSELAKARIEIVDLSSVKTSDGLNHAKFAASPKIVGLIGRRLAADSGIASRGPDFGERFGTVTGGVVGALGSSVEFAVNAPVQILTGGRGPTLSFTP